jgi:uncharacterized membrane protein
MTLDPLLTAPPVIQVHALAALIALTLGPVALWRRRRDRLHRVTGYAWVMAMGLAALSSFAIPSFVWAFWLGPIHLLAIYALYGLWQAIAAVRRGEVALHRQIMQALYLRGLLIAGAFNLLPGRTSQKLLFPEAPDLSLAAFVATLALTLAGPTARALSPLARTIVARTRKAA